MFSAFSVQFLLPLILFASLMVAIVGAILASLFTSPRKEKPAKAPKPEPVRVYPPQKGGTRLVVKPNAPTDVYVYTKWGETYTGPEKTEFALPLCKKLQTIEKYSRTFTAIAETDLRNVLGLICAATVLVLDDYAKLESLSAERKLGINRLIGACIDALKEYEKYRVFVLETCSLFDLNTIKTIVDEMKNVVSSIEQLRIDHKQIALNNLTVELKVLRDTTRI